MVHCMKQVCVPCQPRSSLASLAIPLAMYAARVPSVRYSRGLVAVRPSAGLYLSLYTGQLCVPRVCTSGAIEFRPRASPCTSLNCSSYRSAQRT